MARLESGSSRGESMARQIEEAMMRRKTRRSNLGDATTHVQNWRGQLSRR